MTPTPNDLIPATPDGPLPIAPGIDAPARPRSATLAEAYAHGPGKAISQGTRPTALHPPPGRVPFAALARQSDFAARLTAVLTAAATPLRWEPLNPHNDHRAYPSPRSAFTVDLTLSAHWRIDPIRRSLHGPGIPHLDDHARLDLVPVPTRLPSGYGPLATALADLETGHLLQALTEAADHHGLHHTLDGPALLLRPSDTATGPPPRPVRSAGIAPRGLSADPRPLPATALHAVARTLTTGLSTQNSGAPITAHLAVHNVTNTPDGWYGPDLRTTTPGPAMDDVQRSFTYPQHQINAASMNMACFLTAPLAEHPDTYRSTLRAAGELAQRVCTTAAAERLFCRPVRSIFESELESAVNAPSGHDAVYLLLIGRPRMADFPYDLSPL